VSGFSIKVDGGRLNRSDETPSTQYKMSPSFSFPSILVKISAYCKDIENILEKQIIQDIFFTIVYIYL